MSCSRFGDHPRTRSANHKISSLGFGIEKALGASAALTPNDEDSFVGNCFFHVPANRTVEHESGAFVEQRLFGIHILWLGEETGAKIHPVECRSEIDHIQEGLSRGVELRHNHGKN